MFFRQYQLGCLSLFSYLVGDEKTGRAVVVDPQRDVSQYIADAKAHGLRIERVIETHFHAAFLSGHLELAAATGATISYGEGAQPDFPIVPLADGTRLSLGDVTLEILATPGHTPGHACLRSASSPSRVTWTPRRPVRARCSARRCSASAGRSSSRSLSGGSSSGKTSRR